VAADADAGRSTTPIQPVFSPESEQLLKRIDAPLYTRPPVTYSEEWVASYVPNQSTYLTAEQLAQLHAQGKRSPLYGQAGTYIQKIYNRLLIDLSYNSARLEGNTYTLADTEHLVIQGVSAPGKLDAERIMIQSGIWSKTSAPWCLTKKRFGRFTICCRIASWHQEWPGRSAATASA
jgi:hypothetical protein